MTTDIIASSLPKKENHELAEELLALFPGVDRAELLKDMVALYFYWGSKIDALSVGRIRTRPDGSIRVFCAACGRGVHCKGRAAMVRDALLSRGWTWSRGQGSRRLLRCPDCSKRQGL